MHQILSFSEIPEQGIQYEITGISWFPDEQVQRKGPVVASLYLARKGENKIEVRGGIETQIILSCDRCLAEFVYTINTPFQLIFEVSSPGEHWHVQDLESGRAEIETVLLDEPRIDVGDILRQQVLLALPEKLLCGPECKGLCSKCGVNLNEGKCSCPREGKNTPFSILEQLKKNR